MKGVAWQAHSLSAAFACFVGQKLAAEAAAGAVKGYVSTLEHPLAKRVALFERYIPTESLMIDRGFFELRA